MQDYVHPTSVAEASALLATAGPPAVAKMGGCEVIPLLRRGELRDRLVVSLQRIPELRRIEATRSGLRIGAAVRLAELERDEMLASTHPLLKRVAAAVASPAIRNMASLAGNVAARLPDSDIVPVLTVLDAMAEIQDGRSTRAVPAEGLPELAKGELISAISLPPQPDGLATSYQRIAARHSLDKPIAAVACALVIEDGSCARAHVAFTGASLLPSRSAAVEDALAGAPLTAESIAAAAELAERAADPPSDRRASSDYRRTLIGVLTRRVLEEIRQGRASAPSRSE